MKIADVRFLGSNYKKHFETYEKFVKEKKEEIVSWCEENGLNPEKFLTHMSFNPEEEHVCAFFPGESCAFADTGHIEIKVMGPVSPECFKSKDKNFAKDIDTFSFRKCVNA